MGLSITFDILKQLNFVFKTISNEVKEGAYTPYYIICESDCNFLDHEKLIEYLSTTKIENKAVLTEVMRLCKDIINLWNNDLQKLPEKKLEPHIFKRMQEKTPFDLSDSNYYPLLLDGGKIWRGRKDNYKETFPHYTRYSVYDIAKRCSVLFNWITAFISDDKQIKKTKRNPLSNPVKAHFCNLLSESKVDPQGERNVEDYCKNICKQYKWEYSDKIRQDFNKGTAKTLKRVKEHIFPIIDPIIVERINAYLEKPRNIILYG